MQTLDYISIALGYIGSAFRDELIVFVVVVLVLAQDAPIVALRLLRRNRPRGHGIHGMYLADRFIQIYLKGQSLDSRDDRFEHTWAPLGHMAGPWRSTMDKTLEKMRLVRRDREQVQLRKGHLYLRNFLVYWLCKWFLIIFCGDNRSWYKELRG